jgi:hypothetical protein
MTRPPARRTVPPVVTAIGIGLLGAIAVTLSIVAFAIQP